MPTNQMLLNTLAHLKTKRKVLLLTTSNRWSGEENDLPKSTLLAQRVATELGADKAVLIDVPALNIFVCEGNVSTGSGNSCGVKKALLKDADKDPHNCHRCWASVNNPTDELWRITKELFESEAVVFFGSVRWGQMNSIYQKLIERLTWLENRHSTLGEDNLLANIEAGIIAIGHNWNGQAVVETQKQVLGYFGFSVADDLCWHWQFTNDSEDESNQTYQSASQEFKKIFLS